MPIPSPNARKLLQQLERLIVLACEVITTSNVELNGHREGIEFLGPPQERPYGIEALVKDDSGNWFSLCQRPRR